VASRSLARLAVIEKIVTNKRFAFITIETHPLRLNEALDEAGLPSSFRNLRRFPWQVLQCLSPEFTLCHDSHHHHRT
jgi:hypothetical protein